MKTNANQNTSTIYYRPLKQWIEVTPEQKRDWERFVGTTRKAKQRAGACCIPYKKSYKCDGLCDTCEFRCIPKDASQHLSIDTEMESAYGNGVSRTSFLADSRLTTEIDIDSLILNGLLTELLPSSWRGTRKPSWKPCTRAPSGISKARRTQKTWKSGNRRRAVYPAFLLRHRPAGLYPGGNHAPALWPAAGSVGVSQAVPRSGEAQAGADH